HDGGGDFAGSIARSPFGKAGPKELNFFSKSTCALVGCALQRSHDDGHRRLTERRGCLEADNRRAARTPPSRNREGGSRSGGRYPASLLRPSERAVRSEATATVWATSRGGAAGRSEHRRRSGRKTPLPAN